MAPRNEIIFLPFWRGFLLLNRVIRLRAPRRQIMKNGLRLYSRDQRAGKDGLLEDRQAYVFAPWRPTYQLPYQLPLGLQTKIL